MKEIFDKKIGADILETETPLEAVEQLEEFLLQHIGDKDFDSKFLKTHFRICRDDIKRLEKNAEREKEVWQK